MYEVKILEQFSKLPVFSLADVNQIINNRNYAKKFLKRMVKNKKIFKIKKNIYTLHDDPFLISIFLVRPSYVSSVSALSYHKLITQIPNEIFCATSKRAKKIRFVTQINFFHTNYLFGFKKERYENFNILVADPEKAIIDSLSIIPFSIFEEAIESINEKTMLTYLARIKKSNIVKRIGYLMEKNGFDVYEKLKKYMNYKYIPLDPLLKKRGKRDRKWNLVINVK